MWSRHLGRGVGLGLGSHRTTTNVTFSVVFRVWRRLGSVFSLTAAKAAFVVSCVGTSSTLETTTRATVLTSITQKLKLLLQQKVIIVS